MKIFLCLIYLGFFVLQGSGCSFPSSDSLFLEISPSAPPHPFSSSAPSGTLIMCILLCRQCPISLLGFLYFQSIFFFSLFLWLDNFIWPIFMLTNYFFCLVKVKLKLSIEFFYVVIVFFSSRILVWLFSMGSITFLDFSWEFLVRQFKDLCFNRVSFWCFMLFLWGCNIYAIITNPWGLMLSLWRSRKIFQSLESDFGKENLYQSAHKIKGELFDEIHRWTCCWSF